MYNPSKSQISFEMFSKLAIAIVITAILKGGDYHSGFVDGINFTMELLFRKHYIKRKG